MATKVGVYKFVIDKPYLNYDPELSRCRIYGPETKLPDSEHDVDVRVVYDRRRDRREVADILRELADHIAGDLEFDVAFSRRAISSPQFSTYSPAGQARIRDVLDWWQCRRVAPLHFGGCPVCGHTGEYRNIGANHWLYCPEHKCKWLVGANLFSSWKEMTEAGSMENAEYLREFLEIEPVSDVRETVDWIAGNRAETLIRMAEEKENRRKVQSMPAAESDDCPF